MPVHGRASGGARHPAGPRRTGRCRGARGGMKICHVAPELLPVPPTKGGAIERWIRDAATTLAARGHDVHVVSRDHGDGRIDETIAGVRYHYVRVPNVIDRGLPAVMLRGLWHYE